MGRFADADVCAFWAMQITAGARAGEEDGQQNKLDDNGDYAVGAEEVKLEAKPEPSEGLSTAIHSPTSLKAEVALRNQALTWRIQALTQMEKLPPGHDGRKVRVVKYPKPSEITSTEKAPSDSSVTTTANDSGSSWQNLWTSYSNMYKTLNIRCSYYQTETTLTVDIFVKNLSPQQVDIDSKAQSIRISPVQGVSLNKFEGPVLLLLFGEIKPEATKYTVKSMKIELVLQKAKAGNWPALRRENADIVDNLSISPSQVASPSRFQDFITALGYKSPKELELPDVDGSPAWYIALLEKLRSKIDNGHGSSSVPKAEKAVPTQSTQPKPSAEKTTTLSDEQNIAAKTSSNAPAYPTSSKSGPKNWDKIDDGDDEDAAQNGDVNSFFQQIYKGADEDTKRAMMKSFVESNGTALSTSWSDAKSKTYKTLPPDGAEAKKWE
ncbi:hypothetical protein NUW58_g4360 [Xylaria curta]|uniref:Uncharacterized protein n=1 Tax=Xylaria curta TaxID=42375 RepID=A0ACC1P9B2_9PEZI|nr:hypothetical protein NUW58_g4360 [Xylaria curta]